MESLRDAGAMSSVRSRINTDGTPRGVGNGMAGLTEHAGEATTHSSRMNTDGTPRTVSEGSMNWSTVNHAGFTDCD